MSQNAINLKFKGLFTDPNNLGSVPTGALSQADNVNIDRDDIIEPRRGFQQYGQDLPNLSKNLLAYKNRLLVHSDNKIFYDNRELEITSLTCHVAANITNISVASPAVITSNGHGLTTGNVVSILNSSSDVNGRWEITVIDPNTFSLDGSTNATLATDGQWKYYTSTALATTVQDHGLKVGDRVTIVGSDYIEYNRIESAILTVPSTNSFTYAITNPTKSPSTGAAKLKAGVWQQLTTPLLEPESGRKIRSAELNANMYVTSADGIRKFTDPTLDHTSAGVPRGLNARLALVDSPGFLPYDSQVAYRIVWGIRDGNNNLILGAPSERTIITNSGLDLIKRDLNNLLSKLDQDTTLTDNNYSSLYVTSADQTFDELVDSLVNSSTGLLKKLDDDVAPPATKYITIASSLAPINTVADLYELFDALAAELNADAGVGQSDFNPATASQQVQLTINIPDQVNTDYFVQVYRSRVSADIEVAPDDELFLAYEANPTSAEITAGELVITDITTQAFLGTSLYSNATQEGSTQTNEPPPFAKDVAIFKNSLFFANTRTRHNLEVALLGTEPLATETSADSLSFPSAHRITRILDSGSNTAKYYLDYIDGNDKLSTEFTVNHKLEINDTLAPGVAVSNRGIFDIISVEDAITGNTSAWSGTTFTSAAPHNLQVGDSLIIYNITLSSQTVVLNPIYTRVLTVVSPTQVTISESSPAGLDAGSKWRRPGIVTVSKSTATPDHFTSSDFAKGVPTTLTVNSQVYTFKKPLSYQIDVDWQDATNLTNGDYITLTTPRGTRYHFIVRLDAGALIIPSVSGIYIPFNITTGGPSVASRINGNTALAAAINSVPDFSAEAKLTHTSVTFVDVGPVQTVFSNLGIQNVTKRNTIDIAVNRIGANGEDVSNKLIKLASNASAGVNVDETARSIIRVINADINNSVVAFYLSGVDDVPGKFLLKASNITDSFFSVSSTTSTAFSPDLSTSVNSDNEVIQNRIYYSKVNQPEAVPLFNFLDVGGRELPIQRIVALRDSLFVFKRDGIYRISGESVFNLQLSLFDSSNRLVAPESAVVGNNQVFAFSDQGIIAVTDTGVTVISSPIDNSLSKFYGPDLSSAVTNFTFGIFSETDRKYFIWLPTDPADVTATQAYIYNIATQAWTRYPIAKTCGILNPTDNKLYLGSSDMFKVEQERKDFSYRDHADQFVIKNVTNANLSTPANITSVSLGKPVTVTTSSKHLLNAGDSVIVNNTNTVPTINGKYSVNKVISPNQFNIKTNQRVIQSVPGGTALAINNKISFASLDDVEVGDLLVQPYYLNVFRFNQLLVKLDLDLGLLDTDYFDTLKVTTQEEIPNATVALANKLTADLGTNYNYLAIAQTAPRNLQFEFNSIIELLNFDSGVDQGDFEYSDNSLIKEVRIKNVDVDTGAVTLDYDAELVQDECILHKAIVNVIEWAPQHAGDASIYKQHSEMQTMFGEFKSIELDNLFKTEINPSFVKTPLTGTTGAVWGISEWGNGLWGADYTSYSMRTYVPTEAQRGRFIIPKIVHRNAYEFYSLQGAALIFRPISTRISR
jgi:hypothetical protein